MRESVKKPIEVNLLEMGINEPTRTGRYIPGKVDVNNNMILLTKINDVPITVNSDLIQHIEETPDTIITMTNNEKVVVRERMKDIIEKVVQFRRSINNLLLKEYE